eukprot:gene10075-7198_t
MCNRQRYLTEIAQKVQTEIIEERDRDYLQHHEQKEQAEYPIGSLVLVKNMSKKDKLLTPWLGPYRVVNQEGARFELQNLVTLKTRLVHVTLLKPFQGSGNPLDELEDLTIEPYDNVKRNAVVHRYLEQHGLQRLIPPEYRQAS